MQLVYDRSSDVVTCEIDGKPVHHFDENELYTMMKLAAAD